MYSLSDKTKKKVKFDYILFGSVVLLLYLALLSYAVQQQQCQVGTEMAMTQIAI